MTPPVPVPSKAAIHALRGLALGTSCAIGVIVEDRRRRITTLQTAVSNKERLQSARRYKSHPAEASTWLPYDEAAVAMRSEAAPRGLPTPLHTSELPPQGREGHKKTPPETSPASRDRPRRTQHDMGHQRQDATTTHGHGPRNYPVGRRPLRNTNQPQNLRVPGTIANKAWGVSTKAAVSDPEEIPSIIASIKTELANKADTASIDRAVAEFIRGCELTNAHETHSDEWNTLSSRLAQECRERGRWDHALAIIKIAVRPGTINEAEFYAHAPFEVIRKLISPNVSGIISRGNFNTAVSLFNTIFPQKPQMHSEEVEELGKELITVARRLHDVKSMESIYWRVLPQSSGSDFIGWFIKSLSDTGEHNRAIKFFVLCYAKEDPSFENLQETVECVIQAVEQTSTAKADRVLQAFLRMPNAADGTLRSRWVLRLLSAHWSCHENYQSFRALFEDVRAQGLFGRTSHPHGAFRMVIEYALKAGEDEEAQRYYKEATRILPQLGKDISVKGYFALRELQKGDLAATELIFEEMQQLVTSESLHIEYTASFLQLLKGFAKTNAVEDVRSFLDKYILKYAIKLDTWMMTIVANKYGEAGDMAGFFSWLEYCFASGVPLDASFCNLVLDACRKRWDLPYDELKELSRKMRALNPAYVDEDTRRILRMSLATTTTQGMYRSKQMQKLVLDNRTLAGQTLNAHFLADAMHHHLGKGNPRAALRAYERASILGMPHSEQCLRLAVRAHYHKRGQGHEEAWNLIRAACEKGRSVTKAAGEYMKQELERVRGSPTQVLSHMQKTAAQIDALHIELEPEIYGDAALTCVQIGQHDRARMLCKLAMEKAGATSPYFSRHTFRALLKSYTQTLDVERLKELVVAIPHSELAVERKLTHELKSVRRQVQKMSGNPERIREVLGTLQIAIEDAKAKRGQVAGQNAAASSEAMRIMTDAVAQFETIKQAEDELKQLEAEARDAIVAEERETDERPDGDFYMMQFRLTGDVKKLGYRISTLSARSAQPSPPRPRSTSRTRPTYISLLGDDTDDSSSDTSTATY